MTFSAIATAESFAQWLAKGETGICIYHIGNLAEMANRNRDLRALANAAYAAAYQRQVYLVQRRPLSRKENTVEYLAIKPADGTKVPHRFAPGLSVDDQITERERKRKP